VITALAYLALIPLAVIVGLVTRTILDARDRRSKRRGLHRAVPAQEEQVMSEYVCEIAVSAKTGRAIPDDATVGGELFDILADGTAADSEIPFVVTSMTISPVSPGQ
jgi:transcriptional regulator of met regulon